VHIQSQPVVSLLLEISFLRLGLILGLLRCEKDKLFVHNLSIGGMVGFDPAQFGIQAGGGAVVGGVIGFAAKKIIKLVAALVGVQLGLLAYLEHQGIVSVDWSQLRSVASVTAPATDGGIPPFVFDALSVLPAGGGFTVGALAGFKKG